jgi:four helix bundle protein
LKIRRLEDSKLGFRILEASQNLKTREKIYDISERTFQFSLRILSVFKELKKLGSENYGLGKQLLRSGTAVGALCQEAHSGESKADTAHKYAIALKEARETLYWLRLLVAHGSLNEQRTKPLLTENDEIIRIIVTIVVRLKS